MSVEARQLAVLRAACATVLFVVAVCTHGAASAEDLLAIWQLALSQDTAYAAAGHALQAVEQKLPQARAGLLPALMLGLNTSTQAGSVGFDGTAPGDRRARSAAWNLQLAQALWRPERRLLVDQAQAQVRQAREQFRLAGQELILRITQSYLDVLVATESARVSLGQLKAVAAQLRLAQRNFEAGVSTITDTYEAQARFDLARAQRVAALAELEGRHAELEKILGRQPSRLVGFRGDGAAQLVEPGELAHWMDLARRQHPQVMLQEAALQAATLDVSRQAAADGPSLDLNASGGSAFNSGSLATAADSASRTRSVQIGLQLNMPLYTGGAAGARMAEAIAGRDRAESELLGARRQAAAQARQAYAGLVQGAAQAEALASAVVSSRSALDASKIGYRIGTRINIDVLNAEQQLFAARRDLFKARADTVLYGMRLKAAAGVLEPRDIEAANALLQDTAPANTDKETP